MFKGYDRCGCDVCDAVGGYGDGPCGGYCSYWERYRCGCEMRCGCGYCRYCGRPYYSRGY